ncbi:MAG: 16S rRNA (cytosine(967)-C(5))-methyltransferase RsmB [Gammaproteobacteria bacterium]|nr:16S rRNA (cytosine(967)-C(5))-methyltransferase RsmB [Gammaproteobacteria bacterium]
MTQPIPVRALAARVLAEVMRDGAYLGDALQINAARTYAARDAALLQELCYGTLRFQSRLEFWLAGLLQQPLRTRDIDLQALLLLGLYQLTCMRIPAHAVVKETVEACRYLHKAWAVKLVNAVLRGFQRQRAALESNVGANPVAEYSHPRWFIERVQADWPTQWQALLLANNQRPPMTLRANRRLIARDALIEKFTSHAIAAQACRHSADGLVLTTPVDVRLLPGFGDGEFSVQDEAAQLAANLLDVHPGMRLLDACAAPGGKTCHLLEHQPEIGRLMALDIDANRVGKIHENLQRLGLAAEVRQADVLQPDDWWDGECFERILLDAPCSASGVIRRHPDIKSRRRPRDLETAAALQRRMLAVLWPLLASGGKLLYATCSVFRRENDDCILAFLETQSDAKLSPFSGQAAWGVDTPAGRQVLTGQEGMDGFFYACLEKRA